MLSFKLDGFTHYTIKRMATQRPTLSIIIPVYNRPVAIANCLNQLKNTEYNKNDVEIILIDDCSSDNTYDILQSYLSDFPNIITLKREENSGGASQPRNNGLEIASGKWVLFIDSDDHITSFAISDALAAAQCDAETDMVCMPYFKAEGSGRAIMASAFPYNETKTGLTFTQTKLYNSLNVVGKLFRASLIAEYQIIFPAHIKVREDNWFMMKLYSVVRHITILGNKKQYYFINEVDNVSLAAKGTSPAAAVEIYLSAYDFICSRSGLGEKERLDYLAIYLNRYANMIRRGKNAPLRFFKHTQQTLKALSQNPHITENAKSLIADLYAGKYSPPTRTMAALKSLLDQTKATLTPTAIAAQPAHFPAYILLMSISNGQERAFTVCGKGSTFNEAWAAGEAELARWQHNKHASPIWLRVDIVNKIQTLRWDALQEKLSRTKRNYFRFGLSFTPDFRHPILEQEINANALMYQGAEGVATPNNANLANFSRWRFSSELCWPERPEQLIWRFNTRSVFCDGEQVYPIESSGRNAGYRQLSNWQEEALDPMIFSATDYLARQVQASGRYDYGWFPCFDRAIPTYNALRHASSTYALLEGWEVTQEPTQFAAIERALHDLSSELIATRALPDGSDADFLIDTGGEIKLGGNAVCILAMAKYTELTGDQRYLPQMQRLANGIGFMQKTDTGGFNHVLNAADLSLKAEHRIIYYDGEAAFALMRLYGLTKTPRWLEIVERAMDHFIAQKHWQAHDHWLSYCVNELTLYRPLERYYQFGLDNVRDHLDFVINRVTTYPTLLELMMAASRMLSRLATSEHRHLLDEFDLEKFNLALETRARYLANGFFWPELAMFFKNPPRIVGSFFIRHHSFRVRIDDVEHYLSGYVAYRKHWRHQHDKTT